LSDPVRTAPHWSRAGRYILAYLAGLVPTSLVVTALWLDPAVFHGLAELALLPFGLMFVVAARRLGVSESTRFLRFLIIAGVAVAFVSYLTGGLNRLTDEPYTTPRYVGLLLNGQNPYTTALSFTYVQYGVAIHSSTVYVYLPLLMFLQVPYFDYKIFTTFCWLAILYLVRENKHAVLVLAQPYMGIMAINGFNDFPALLLVAFATVGIPARYRWVSEALALGSKQFAGLVIFLGHLLRKEWRRAAIALGVTALILAPFLVWSPSAVLCQAVLYGLYRGCGVGTGQIPYGLNYSIWPLWIFAVYSAELNRWIAQSAARTRVERAVERLGVNRRLMRRLFAYVAVGVSGIFVNLVVFVSLLHLGGASTPSILLASAGAFAVATVWNFVWNFAWAFEGLSHRSLRHHLAVYLGIQAGVLGAGLALLYLGVAFGAAPVIGQAIAILGGSVLGFVMNSRWNFHQEDLAPREA
jgi:putative flippase GtrA